MKNINDLQQKSIKINKAFKSKKKKNHNLLWLEINYIQHLVSGKRERRPNLGCVCEKTNGKNQNLFSQDDNKQHLIQL